MEAETVVRGRTASGRYSFPVGHGGRANIGDVVNWTGSDMAQANWYAFGRFVLNTELSAHRLPEEFLKQTLSRLMNISSNRYASCFYVHGIRQSAI